MLGHELSHATTLSDTPKPDNYYVELGWELSHVTSVTTANPRTFHHKFTAYISPLENSHLYGVHGDMHVRRRPERLVTEEVYSF